MAATDPHMAGYLRPCLTQVVSYQPMGIGCMLTKVTQHEQMSAWSLLLIALLPSMLCPERHLGMARRKGLDLLLCACPCLRALAACLPAVMLYIIPAAQDVNLPAGC